MAKFRIGVLDPIASEGIEILKGEPDFEFEERVGLKGDELRSALNEFDGVIIRSGVKITAESLEGNKRLRAIVRAGVGTDNIDKEASTRLGIVVMNTPSGNTLSTAEHAFALMICLAKKLLKVDARMRQRGWLWPGREFLGRLRRETKGPVRQ